MSTISSRVIHSLFYDFSAKTVLKTSVLHIRNIMKNITLLKSDSESFEVTVRPWICNTVH